MANKILKNVDEISMTEQQELDGAQVVVIAYGICGRAARFAARMARNDGMKVGFLRPITIWPFPEKTIRQMAGNVKTIIVVEENRGQLVLEVERLAHGKSDVRLVNRYDGILITPQEILAAIKEAY